MLAWGAKVSKQFREKAIAIALKGRFDPNWLMSVMAFESGETFSPSIRNELSGATGLIQFMENYGAKQVGKTTEQLAAETAEEQLDDVEKYYDQFLGQIKTLADCYMAVFWPAAVGKPDDYQIVTNSASKAYIQNKGLDLNKDGTITKAEAASFIAQKLKRGLDYFASSDESPTTITPTETTMDRTGAIDVIGGIASMLSPVAGIVFNAFSPIIKENIASEVDRHAPAGTGAQVGDALVASLAKTLDPLLQQQAVAKTERSDPLEAAAVLVQPQHAAELKEVETEAVNSVKARIDALSDFMPILKASSEIDQARWAAERQGRQDASDAAIKEKKAGLWDYTRALVYSTCAVMVLVSIGLLVMIGAQAVQGLDINVGIIGLAGPIWMGTMATAFMAMVTHRFDGSRQASEQTQTMLKLAQGDKS